MYEVGHGKPPVEGRFKPGVSGNPGGKTSKQRRAEIANAERATRLRSRMLKALEKKLDDAMAVADGDDMAAVAAIQNDVLRLLKDTEDRGFGTPTAKVEGPGPLGEHLHKVGPDDHASAVLAALTRKHDAD